MKVYLIRHGQTKGNRERRYVGRTDEPLSAEAREALLQQSLFLQETLCPDVLYVSPMQRCRDTAQILFPETEQIEVEAFRECDFGAFEYKNYEELSGNPDYQRFLDSGGTCAFPDGEDINGFRDRCAGAFYRVIDLAWKRKQKDNLVFVVHGGTIMAILDRFSHPHKSYFAWQTENGNGYAADVSYDERTGTLSLNQVTALKE
ncbi:MAG: histidine phosphatase family protein [Candidatus Gastranaerophilales bacterium]|nr:histidine phosphatase family protein [Candidatus Gastranaerophilales bacterium]